jgi:predicted transcriptional regulator
VSGDLTLGSWNKKRDQFDVFAKIRNPEGEQSALAIYTPQSLQDVLNCLKVLEVKGLLRREGDYYIVTPEGERYRSKLQTLLHTPQMEERQNDEKA